MSDNQRRVICRLVFLLVCALPTAISSYWICHPQTADGWAQAIKAETGLEASIDSVETPSPYETVLRQLTLTDPEQGILFETVEVRIRFGKQVEVEIPYEVRNVNNHGLARLIKTINQNVVRGGVDKNWRLRFTQPLKIARGDAPAGFTGPQAATENSLLAMLYDQQNSFEIEGLSLDVGPSFDGTDVRASFELPQPAHLQQVVGSRARKGIDIQLKKEPQGQAIWLDTFGQTLPCWLAADFIGDFIVDFDEGLGSDADFTGELKVKSDRANGQNLVYLDGILSQLSLSSYPLNVAINEKTRMQITLDQCQFENGQPTQWSAVLDVPELQLRSRIDPQTLFQNSRRFVVGKAIDTAIINGATTRIASEPSANGTY